MAKKLTKKEEREFIESLDVLRLALLKERLVETLKNMDLKALLDKGKATTSKSKARKPRKS